MNIEAISQALRNRRIGHRVIWFDVIGSTNAELLRRGGTGELEDGTLMIADAQTGGKGSGGRSWHSPPGVNIYLSVSLGGLVDPADAPFMPLVGGVAVARTLEGLGFSPQLKWPNDVLIGRKKTAGILSEMSWEGQRVRGFVLGVGLNVNMEPETFPADIATTATSLRTEGGRIYDREAVVISLLCELDQLLFPGGPDAPSLPGTLRRQWVDDWSRYDLCRGQRLTIRLPDEEITGQGAGVGPDGSLLVLTDGGAVRGFRIGEVRLVPVPGRQ